MGEGGHVSQFLEMEGLSEMGMGVVFEMGSLNPSTNYALVHNFLSTFLRLLTQECTMQNPH